MVIDRDKSEIKKTDREKTYFKVLRRAYPGEGQHCVRYWSPFYLFHVELGVEYDLTDLEPWDIQEDKSEYSSQSYVKGGCFHLFENQDDAEEEFGTRDPHSRYVVVKAIVPEGTEYLEGHFCKYPGVCVKKVIYEKI